MPYIHTPIMSAADTFDTQFHIAGLGRVNATITERIEGAGEPQFVPVPNALLKLLNRAGITPPVKGELLDVAAIDKKMADAKLDVGERMQVKVGLVDAKLLSPGRRIG